MTRAEAISELLSRPDEPCLRRGHYYTQDGVKETDELKRKLGRSYVAHRLHDHLDISCVESTWKQTKLRVVRTG